MALNLPNSCLLTIKILSGLKVKLYFNNSLIANKKIKKVNTIVKKLTTPNLLKNTWISLPLANPAPIIVANIKQDNVNDFLIYYVYNKEYKNIKKTMQNAPFF